MTHDRKVAKLAELWLDDYPGTTDELVDSLADAIQGTIEDWVSDNNSLLARKAILSDKPMVCDLCKQEVETLFYVRVGGRDKEVCPSCDKKLYV